MRKDCKEIKRYVKALTLTGMYNLQSGLYPDFEDGVEVWKYMYRSDGVMFVFRDEQNNTYTHYQENPNNCKENAKSRAQRYLVNMIKSHNWQHPDKQVTYNMMLPDFTHNGEISASKYMIGSDFVVDVCERVGTNKKYGKRTYRNADYVDYTPPSKLAIDKLKKYKCSEEYKEMTLKRKKWEKDDLEYAARRMNDFLTFQNFYDEIKITN